MRAKRFAILLALVAMLMPAAAYAACDGRLLDAPEVLNAPVCIPHSPARIVVLDPTFSLGMALELDLPLAGAPLTGMSDTALQAEAKGRGVVDLGNFLEPSIERLAALRPDLIIGSAMAAEAYPLLSQLAPTVLISAEDWKAYLSLIARAGGREEKAAALLAIYDARVAALRPRIPQTPVSIVRITPWDFQVYLDGPRAYGPFAVLRDLGVKRTAYETTQGDEALKRPDWEGLAALNGDVLLYIVGGANNSATSGRHEEVLQNPLWQMLPAVKAGRVHRVDAGTWMEFSGITSANRVLDEVERIILPAQ